MARSRCSRESNEQLGQLQGLLERERESERERERERACKEETTVSCSKWLEVRRRSAVPVLMMLVLFGRISRRKAFMSAKKQPPRRLKLSYNIKTHTHNIAQHTLYTWS